MEIASWGSFFEILGALAISGYTSLFIMGLTALLFVLAMLATCCDSDFWEEKLQAACYRSLIWGFIFASVWATVKWILT